MTLGEATTPTLDGTRYRLEVLDGWRQGKGAFGGLTIAAAIRAIEHRVGDAKRRVRSVTAEIPGPTLAGAAEVDVEILRSGKSVTTARATLSQGGEVKTHVVAILAASRPGAGPLAWRDLQPPEVPAWRSLEPVEMPAGAPEFSAGFEYRVVEGIPFSGAETARCVGWVRARDPGDQRDAAYLAAMADSWWPAALVKVKGLGAVATISYTLELLDGVDDLDPLAPLLYRGTVPVCADGYFLETRELWGEDGRLVAVNYQTFAII